MKSVISMTQQILLNSGVLIYEFSYKAVKNINLRIKGDGSVCVSAPRWVQKREIESFIRQKEAFIRDAQKKLARHMPTETEVIPSDGQIVPILGQEKIVRIEPALRESVEITGEEIRIRMRAGAKPPHAKYLLDSYINAAFSKQIVRVCSEMFPRFCAEKPELVFPHITIRRMTSRYGSCNPTKNAVTFNTVLFHCPESLTAYVVCHEFTHFFVQNHSSEFYSCFAHFLPDYAEKKVALKSFVTKYPLIWKI